MKAIPSRFANLSGIEITAFAAMTCMSISTPLSAQQSVFNRSDSGTGDWGSGSLPWFYQTSNNNQGDPDNGNTTRNDVFIGHNNNTTMSLTGRFYLHRDFTFQAGASTARTINNTTNGGFSFSRSLINASTATHVFNAPVGIDGNNAEIRADNSAGGLTLNGSIFTNGNQVYFRGPGSITLAGAMTQGGNLVKQGSGTLAITGSANFSGGLFIDAGTLRLNRTVSGTGVVDIGSAAGVGSDQTAALEISSNIDLSRSIRVRNEGTSPGPRQLNFTHGSGSATISGGIELLKNLDVSNVQAAGISGTITGVGGIGKTGAGILTLSGSNNYTGTTTVSAGTLVINGNQSSSTGNVSVSGTLGGSGTVGGATTISSGGTHAAGNNGIGKQTFSNNLTYSNSSSIFSWELGSETTSGRGTSFDAVDVGGALGVSDSIFKIIVSGLNITGTFWDTPLLTWDVFNKASTGKFDTFQLFAATDLVNPVSYGSQGTFSFDATSGDLKWTAVPEPSGVLAGVLLAAGLMRRRRGR